MSATERAEHAKQARSARNTATLRVIERRMDDAMEKGWNFYRCLDVLHEDIVEELEEAGYTVTIREGCTVIAW